LTKQTARQVIVDFLATKEAGTTTSFSATTMTKAAEDMFTAKGLYCPVQVLERNGAVVLINRDIYNAANDKVKQDG
jgi:hypothetical protein